MSDDRVDGSEASAAARVVAIEGDKVWLEPLQTGSCGSCASAAVCGSKGIGTLASRLEARRFAVDEIHGLAVGDTVELALSGRKLIQAAALAYVLPLLAALIGAGMLQARFGSDAITLLGALAGMATGFAAMRLVARRLEACGSLHARIVRHHHPIHFSHPGAHCDA